MFNKIQLIGRLGQDPELKYTADGKSIANFTMAIDQKEGGEKTTMWLKVAFFGNIADSIKQYVSKGDLIFVDGSLRIKDYQDKEGQKKKDVSVTGNTVKFLQTKRKEGDNTQVSIKKSSRPETNRDPSDDESI